MSPQPGECMPAGGFSLCRRPGTASRVRGYDVAVEGREHGVSTLGSRRLDGRQDLFRWRRAYLAEVGVDPKLPAAVAADLRWDLHALLQLVDRGCPPHLAARILAPLDEGRRQ